MTLARRRVVWAAKASAQISVAASAVAVVLHRSRRMKVVVTAARAILVEMPKRLLGVGMACLAISDETSRRAKTMAQPQAATSSEKCLV